MGAAAVTSKRRPARREPCSDCGGATRIVRSSYEFGEVGIPVVLQGIQVIHCLKCGNSDPVIPNMDELMRVIALAVINIPDRIKGKEVRFLRKYLGMTGQKFASIIGVDKTTVSRWENDNEAVGPHSDRVIRMVAMSLGDGLEEQLRELIAHFPDIWNKSKPSGIDLNTQDMSYQYT